MKYRAEIDGLRALAVVPVILFHAGFELFSGGFVGVDVFFVISGYLITKILIEDIENNRFSILKFYERRARRILPALFFVLLCCIPFAWMWMLPSQMQDFSKSLVAVSLFASNILFWRESGYFSVDAEEKPLLHTWSLAVEEQYYVLFPFFLLIVWRFGKNRVFWMIVVFAAISFALSEWGWRNNAVANFYLAPTRAWELFAGSIAAFIVQNRCAKPNNLLSLVGLAAIVFAVFVYDESTPFPSVYALVPVLGVVLLVLYAQEETFVAKLLSMKVFVGIGLISYSAYLWHQPLFAFARIRSINAPSEHLMLLLSVILLILSFISWKFVEQPFRIKDGFLRKRYKIHYFASFCLVSFLVIGLGGYIVEGYSSRLDGSVIQLIAVSKDRNPYMDSCNLNNSRNKFNHPLDGCADFFVDGRASVILVGDSHSDALSHQVQLHLKRAGIGSYSVSYSGCIGLVGFYRADRDSSHKCNEYNESMIKYAKESGIKTVVITSRFPLYLHGNRFDNKEGGIEFGDYAFVDVIAQKGLVPEWNTTEREIRVEERYKSSIEELLANFNVVLVEPIPEPGWNVPIYFAKSIMFDEENIKESTSLQRYIERNKSVFGVFDSINHDRLFRVKTSKFFCSEFDGRCKLRDEGGVFYRDDNHLSAHGAEFISNNIAQVIRQSLN